MKEKKSALTKQYTGYHGLSKKTRKSQQFQEVGKIIIVIVEYVNTPSHINNNKNQGFTHLMNFKLKHDIIGRYTYNSNNHSKNLTIQNNI